MLYSEYYYGSKQAEAFKNARTNIAPVNTERFDRLYSAVASLLFRTNMTPVYASDFNSMLKSAPGWPSDFVEEQWGPARTTDGRLLHTVVYTESSMRQKVVGMVATVGIAPAPAKNIRDIFDLSTDGTQVWITEKDTLRSIGDKELEQLTLDLETA